MDQVSMTTAWMWSIVVMVVCFLVALVIANAVLFKPNDPGTSTRRIWFWIFGVLSVVIGFIVNYIIADGIDVPSAQSDYHMHSGISAGVCFVVYVIVGFAVSKLFPNSKVGTWF